MELLHRATQKVKCAQVIYARLLTVAITWALFEKAIHAVFIESLRRLAAYSNLPSAEEPINLWLHWLAERAHFDLARSPERSLPFTISFDARSQPEPDDASGDPRLLKRPDFTCLLFNEQAADPLRSQLKYYLECKRLGSPEGGMVFNQLYSEKGVSRFMTQEHAYAKGCQSASMIGYIQTMDPHDILQEVNQFATVGNIPSLSRAARSWLAKEANRLSHAALARQFDMANFQLTHFWIDLRHCTFDVPANQPPESAAPTPPPKKRKRKVNAKKSRAKKNQPKKK
jgi:hypothetical protein